MVFVAALLPFGPFVVDRRMKRYEDEYRGRAIAEPPADGASGV
jgi:hypothetical protein